MWQAQIREALRLAIGRHWQQCIIPDLEVLALPDGAWLRLEERMLQLFQGTSTRERIVWMKGTPIDEIVAMVGPQVPLSTKGDKE